MRIFITGASGYFGKNLTDKLVSEGHQCVCLIRKGSETKLGKLRDKVEIVRGEIGEFDGWKNALKNCDAVINLIGIIREFPSRGITFKKLHVEASKILIDSAQEAGVNRFLQMSALGVGPDSKAEYHRTKFEAEEYLRNSQLEWTILRPSLIIGKGNQAIDTIVSLIKNAPFTPVIGDGKYRMQPVDIENVVDGFVKSLDNPETIGKTFDIAGPDKFTYNRMLEIIGSVIEKKVRRIHSPVCLMKMVAGVFEYFTFFPLTTGQINMLMEENITDDDSYFKLLDIKPVIFKDSVVNALN